MTSLHKLLIQIEQSSSFEQLEPLKSPDVWKNLSHEERFLLARLLVIQGSHQLSQGSQQVIESFAIALDISNNHADILFQQALAYASYKDNIRCLYLASSALHSCLQQNPNHFYAWFLLGQVKTFCGLFETDVNLLNEANDCFEKAYLQFDADQTSKEEFFWKWGLCLFTLGKMAGEPCDINRANEKYYLAYALGFRVPEFLNDYGESFALLSSLLAKYDYIKEAFHLFNEAIAQDDSFFAGWLNRACTLRTMCRFEWNDILLEEAELSFIKASELNPEDPNLWTEWAIHEAALAKISHDPMRMKTAQKKFAQAELLDPHHANPLILKIWAEADLFLGKEEESLQFLHEARSKIIKSLEISAVDPDAWFIYGSCLNELGNYFTDESYFYQAIEKFKYGLTLTDQNGALWYGLALTHFHLAEISEDELSYEKSINCFSLALENGIHDFPEFWNDYAVALMKLGDLTENASYVQTAVGKFEKIFNASPYEIHVENWDLEWVLNYACAFLLLGELTENLQDLEKAIHLSIQIVQFDLTYIQARYQLGISFAALGEMTQEVDCFHKAIEQFQSILDINPEDDVVHIDQGTTYINLGLLVQDPHYPERIQSLLKSAERHFLEGMTLGNALANYLLAGLYSLLEQYDQAMFYLERADKLDVLPDIEELLHDEWLEGLRQTPAFRCFIDELSSQYPTEEK
jgi:tetratricopeptide (TPR) repeat protein